MLNLSGTGGGLAGGTTLGTHLGDLASGLALGGTSVLGLVSLLGGGGGLQRSCKAALSKDPLRFPLSKRAKGA